jgi:subtilisin-like proprotein convertase family protein
MKSPVIYALLLLAAAATTPAQILLDYSWTTFDNVPSLTVPDANATGVFDLRSIAAGALKILKIEVTFEAAGNYNGDLYLTLQHDSAFGVLLNRPGRSADNSFGYPNAGFNVTFADGAANGDIHTYQEKITLADGAALTGIWEPDARTADPGLTLTTSPRSAYLNSFQGQNVTGDWTLFAADLSGGGQTQILSWGLQITAVPEPRATCYLTTLALLLFAALRKLQKPYRPV